MASYIKQKDGTYHVRFRWVNEDGREIHKRITTKHTTQSGAEREYIKFIAENPEHQKKSVEELNGTVLMYYYKYMHYKKSRVKESTYYEMENIFAKHILPHFKNRTMFHITKLDLLNWQQSIDHYSYKYCNKLRGFFFNFYKFCNMYFDIPNLFLKVEPFAKPNTKKEISFWTREEFDNFISIVDNQQYKTFYRFLYLTGARLGEALALNYKDFDFIKNEVNITKSITEKSRTGPFDITTPKNQTSYRKISLPDDLINQIKIYINHYPDATTNHFFFGNKNSPIPQSTLRRIFKQDIAKSGIKKIRLHDFRHSHASLLISLGANILLVSKRLGHANTQITLNTYSHLFPKDEDQIISKLNKIGTC